MIKRRLYKPIVDRLYKGKAIILVGARQVGKTTLFKTIDSELDIPAERLNCDDPGVRALLSNASLSQLRLLAGNKKMLIIDEAQRVENIGLALKMITDNMPGVQLMVTGSSSLGLRSTLNEPLTGRKFEYEMYPVSTGELYDTYGLADTANLLNNRLVFGSYPEVLTHQEDAAELLTSLSDSYLYKDILDMDSVRKPEILRKLLVALSLQVGSEVSYNEVARTIGTDSKTVERYIDLLEKCYVVFKIPALSRNLRNELKKSKKIFFFDTGIRNAVISNFMPVEVRGDMGQLWENFFITERMKYNSYNRRRVNYYFWRTTDKQEIDLVEEENGTFSVFEMKWNPKLSNKRLPSRFLDSYSPKEIRVVTPDNYLEFLI